MTKDRNLRAPVGRLRPSLVARGNVLPILCVAFTLAACGGGGAADTQTPTRASSGTGYVQGVYMPAAQFKNQCANPRPNTNDAPGSTLTEDLWLRSWINDTYLWYPEVADIDPSGYATQQYFDLLKTTAVTPSGRDKDRYHFTYPTSEWTALSQSGVDIGYGVEWVVVSGSVPRQIMVGYTQNNTPATQLAVPVQRGDQVVAVDNVAVDTATAAQLNDALWPSSENATHTFTLRSQSGATRVVTLTSASVALAPVQNVQTITTASGAVGYLQFNDQLAQSEAALVAAFTQLADPSRQVTDLIVDIRYNGGGYLDIASEAAYMIAGPALTSGNTFELAKFNDKYPSINPATGEANTPTLFHSQANNFSVAAGTPLPTLNLNRVFVLTGNGTCSASESLINGLRGVGVQVIQIGSPTCGKPYGFYPVDNCGTTYFSIQLEGTNARGFGEYADGFYPANASIPSGTPSGAIVPGCSVADDFAHALGDPMEARLAAALGYRQSGTCPAPTGVAPNRVGAKSIQSVRRKDELRGKSELLRNRWL